MPSERGGQATLSGGSGTGSESGPSLAAEPQRRWHCVFSLSRATWRDCRGVWHSEGARAQPAGPGDHAVGPVRAVGHTCSSAWSRGQPALLCPARGAREAGTEGLPSCRVRSVWTR